MKLIRILIADDQALFREGLCTLLTAQADFIVIGAASNGQEAVRMAQELRPDVILMDLKMPILDGAAATKRLLATVPKCRVVALTTFDDDEYVFDALRAGALGYLLKDAPSEQLASAIRSAARGESLLQPSVAAKVVAEFARLAELAPSPPAPGAAGLLSEREVEVLRLVARGASNKEIASALLVTEGTIKNHVTRIFVKLGVTDRVQAALRARELGIGPAAES
jgi:DNA-binding NarL/FixJ family response regulator